MANLRHCLVLAVLCGLSYGLSEITTPKPEIIPIPSKLPTETPSPDTTTSSTTTTPPPTTTTPPPTTTTPPPTTTTPPTTTSTTPKPTTTPVPPSPPAPPKPLPPPDTGSWSYKDNATNITCIVVEFAATLNVTYTKVKNDTSISSFVLLNIPANATVVTGSCNTTEQWLTLSWPTSNVSLANNTLTMAFHQNQTTKDYALKNLNISLTADNFVDPLSKDPIVVYHGAEWQTPLASSYRCKMATRLNMSSEAAGNVVARLTISNLQEEAFRTAPGTGFSAARDCGGGDIPDAVPIAVGCALGGLVVVVLVAYLVGRRRSAARGYLSM